MSKHVFARHVCVFGVAEERKFFLLCRFYFLFTCLFFCHQLCCIKLTGLVSLYVPVQRDQPQHCESHRLCSGGQDGWAEWRSFYLFLFFSACSGSETCICCCFSPSWNSRAGTADPPSRWKLSVPPAAGRLLSRCFKNVSPLPFKCFFLRWALSVLFTTKWKILSQGFFLTGSNDSAIEGSTSDVSSEEKLRASVPEAARAFALWVLQWLNLFNCLSCSYVLLPLLFSVLSHRSEQKPRIVCFLCNQKVVLKGAKMRKRNNPH